MSSILNITFSPVIIPLFTSLTPVTERSKADILSLLRILLLNRISLSPLFRFLLLIIFPDIFIFESDKISPLLVIFPTTSAFSPYIYPVFITFPDIFNTFSLFIFLLLSIFPVILTRFFP